MVGAIDQYAELWKPRILRGLPGFGLTITATNKVGADVMRFQSGRVDCRQRNLSLSPHHRPNGFVKQVVDIARNQKSPGGFLESCVVRHLLQFDGCSQIRTVPQVLNQAPVIRFEKQFQHQTSKQLMLRKLFRRVFVTKLRQPPLGDCPSRQQNLPWRFASAPHAPQYASKSNLVQFSTEHSWSAFDVCFACDKRSLHCED